MGHLFRDIGEMINSYMDKNTRLRMTQFMRVHSKMGNIMDKALWSLLNQHMWDILKMVYLMVKVNWL